MADPERLPFNPDWMTPGEAKVCPDCKGAGEHPIIGTEEVGMPCDRCDASGVVRVKEDTE